MATFVDGLFDHTIPGLMKALDLHQKRSEAISGNISNADTPQYRSVEVTFAGELQKAFGQSDSALQKTNPQHMDVSMSGASHLIPDYSGATRADGNNVDIDIQMSRLADTTVKYSIAANLVSRKLRGLRTAITEAMR